MKQTSIFDSPKPANPKPAKFTRIMCWVKEPDGEWVVKGEKGDFRIWKRGGIWKGRYASYDDVVFFYVGVSKDVKVLKQRCEGNAYWEK